MVTPATNIAEYTVSELAFALKRTVEETYEHVRVRGEISGFRGAVGSGHCYFTLKDDRACLDVVVWKTTMQRLRFKPQEGLEMVATGKLTTYPGRSRYQIVIDSLEPAGQGALMALLDERRKRLEAEGLFAEARKRPIPFLPKVIGVVTSPTGAVIRDILHRLRDRCPCRVVVWPVRVQGDGAAEEVAAAVRGFNAILPGGPVPRPDVLIVARGGGSIEDLWAFNEEVAVRAVAASAIPTIAAVGHETDWTLIDFAADLRAPTPTGAAEKAVPVRADLVAAIADLARRHQGCVRRLMDQRRRDLAAAARALPKPADLLQLPRQRLDHAGGRLARGLQAGVAVKRRHFDAVAARVAPALLERGCARAAERLSAASGRLATAFRGRLRQERRDFARIAPRLSPACLARIAQAKRERLAQAARLLNSVSYEAVLARGFALVLDGDAKPIRRAADIAGGQALRLRFSDGSVGATADGPVPAEGPAGTEPARPRPSAPAPARKPRDKAAPAGQGRLF
ncbi:exodeoxyribonuclease VII large subunit [Faunimonas sp. B44]|uniref:exodeoxyribonuclease VII large subunit n=1 Tax=Faunimonas sp. B44 TaxID=3461493 RepID=UPI004043FFCB